MSALPEPAFETAVTARDLFGQGPVTGSTRERLLDTAMDLFYTHGIHAMGIDQVIAQVGVTKTTFYNHFESKDQFVLEVLQRRDAFESEAWSRAVLKIAGHNPRRMLLAVFEVLDMWFTNPAFRGCQFINAAHEFPAEHDPVNKVAREHEANNLAWFTDLADQAGAREPEQLAQQIGILINGAISSRLLGDRDDAAALARDAAELLLREQIDGEG